jgi:hypothetical protein
VIPARKRLVQLTIAAVILLLASSAFLSLRWRFQQDSPILLYIGWLIERLGYVPYRDIFDMNLPGSYALYALIGKISGYTDFGVRCVDLGILAAEMLLTYLWMKKLGTGVALCGSALWGLFYLQRGPAASLQREYLILLPVLAALLLADRFRGTHRAWAAGGVGLLFGIGAMVKPHAAIGLPVMLLYQQNERRKGGAFVRDALPAAAGFCIPIACAVLALWQKGALPSFLDMISGYWPLYMHLSGEHQTLSGLERLGYLWSELQKLGGFGVWVVPAALGCYTAFFRSGFSSDQKRQAGLLVILAFCYGLYPAITGQFWVHHWLLFLYFALQLAALSMADPAPEVSRGEQLAPVIVLALSVLFQLQAPENVSAALEGREVPPVNNGRVDAIASFLRAEMRPGDSVQPLDWTGGAVHAMLIAEARLATPFIYDFYFYHDISNRYIQGLRRRFIADLRASPPRFIVRITGNDKGWVNGENTTRDFRDLDLLIALMYERVSEGPGYVIYRSRTSLSGGGSR